MYRHFSRFDSLGWHFTVNVPPQQIILAECVLFWDQSCSLMIQVRYFSGLSIVNLIFLLYCASNDICFCNIVCMGLYWALWDMESYFWVHLMYYEEGLGAAASEIQFIQVPEIQVCMSAILLCSYYGVRRIRTVKIKSVTIGSSRFFQIMDWISVSIVYSHLTYYELRMIHDRKSSTSVSCFARAGCSLQKARFTVRKSEISFVLRIIKRNYKLKFSLRAWGSGPQRGD